MNVFALTDFCQSEHIHIDRMSQSQFTIDILKQLLVEAVKGGREFDHWFILPPLLEFDQSDNDNIRRNGTKFLSDYLLIDRNDFSQDLYNPRRLKKENHEAYIRRLLPEFYSHQITTVYKKYVLINFHPLPTKKATSWRDDNHVPNETPYWIVRFRQSYFSEAFMPESRDTLDASIIHGDEDFPRSISTFLPPDTDCDSSDETSPSVSSMQIIQRIFDRVKYVLSAVPEQERETQETFDRWFIIAPLHKDDKIDPPSFTRNKIKYLHDHLKIERDMFTSSLYSQRNERKETAQAFIFSRLRDVTTRQFNTIYDKFVLINFHPTPQTKSSDWLNNSTASTPSWLRFCSIAQETCEELPQIVGSEITEDILPRGDILPLVSPSSIASNDSSFSSHSPTNSELSSNQGHQLFTSFRLNDILTSERDYDSDEVVDYMNNAFLTMTKSKERAINLLKRMIGRLCDASRLDTDIVESIKQWLHHPSIKVSRSSVTRSAKEAVWCAMSATNHTPSIVANRLDHDKDAAYRGREQRILMWTNIYQYDDVLVTRKIRKDSFYKAAVHAVYSFCHDPNVAQPDSNAKTLYTVVNPYTNKEEKHSKQNWIVKCTQSEKYEEFLSSTYYNNYQAYDCGDDKKPSISAERFRRLTCRCIQLPTTASCVDTIEDQVSQYMLSLESYMFKHKLRLLDQLCDCRWCDDGHPKWMALFKRDGKKGHLRRLKDACLCPPVRIESLRLEGGDDFFMRPWKCSHLECQECGLINFPSDCCRLSNNNDLISVMEWEDQKRAAGVQNEIVEKLLTVSEAINKLKTQLKLFLPHDAKKQFSNRTRKIDIETLPDDTLLVCTDFSAQLTLRANRTENCSVDNHAILDVFYVFSNRRRVETTNGQEAGICHTDVYYALGESSEKGKKNDYIYHLACIRHILRNKSKEGYNFPNLRIWTDNCSSQYKCRQYFFNLAQMNDGTSLKLIEHCHAEVFAFKGPWDQAGKVVKDQFQKYEKSEAGRLATAWDCFRFLQRYFKENLPNNIDWNDLEQKGHTKLLHKSNFNINKRWALFVTDDYEDYRAKMDEGNTNIIFTDRVRLHNSCFDCSPLEGSSSMHYVRVDSPPAVDGGVTIKLRVFPCRCTDCRKGDPCSLKNITDEYVCYSRKSIEQESAERASKKSKERLTNITEILSNVVEIKAKHGLFELDEILCKMPLKYINKIMKELSITALRSDGNDCKKEPLKREKIAAIHCQYNSVSSLESALSNTLENTENELQTSVEDTY